MTTKRKLLSLCSVVLAITIVFFACSKDDSLKEEPVPTGKQQVKLFLTDDPALFDKVLIDIKAVQVLIDTCDKNKDDDDDHGHHDDDDDSCVNWATLNITPGVYDLLTLRNGADTLLASGIIPEGKIKKIKIELGTNNSLVKDSVNYPLSLFPGTQATIVLKLKGGEWDEYQPGRSQLWLDFDVSRSVIRVRDNKFYLLPVIKIFTVKTTGSLEGKVLPKEAYPVVSVYNATDTGYAIPWSNGEFKVRGLKEGTYSVFINASNGYQDTTITGVEIRRNRETELDKITLHK